MSQRILTLLFVALLAASCGGGESTEVGGPVAPRALPAPDVEDSSDPATENDGVERVSDSSQSSDDPCRVLEQGLTGPGGQALYDAGSEGPEAQGARLAEAFSGFGAAALNHTETLAAFDGSPGSVAGYMEALDALDELTLERCGFPGGAAMFTTLGAMALVKFGCVDAVISGDEPEPVGEGCGPPSQVFPDVLPCFEATGESWMAVAEGGEAPWDVVDCESGGSVMWDHDKAAWVPLQRVDAFTEISDTIGD